MKLIDLYKELRDPHGFRNGCAVPVGLYEARAILVDIINDGLKETSWEAYSVDKIKSEDDLYGNRIVHMVEFKIKKGKVLGNIYEDLLGTNAIDILNAAEKNWDVLTNVSIVRRD